MRKLVFYILLSMTAAACKEKYELPYSGPAKGYLVVDGKINSGTGPTNIFISRTLALVDSVAHRREHGAAVSVEGENGTQFPLVETAVGTYSHPQLNLQPNVKYRLRIRTADGKVYHSAYTENRKTPDIDNISWEKNDAGVQLYIDTHDPQNNTRYYQWHYEETWEFHSAYSSYLQYVFAPNGELIGIADRDPAEAARMFKCWAGEKATTILIGSSARLSRDTIHLPLLFIPQGSWKIQVKYSILLHQYALSAAAYEFLQRMKKNTEQVGSLFDAQPSELAGNIQNAQDPSEVVIGFVEVAQVKEKRIFIDRSQVNPWAYLSGCYEESIFNHPDSANLGLIPTSVHQYGLGGGIVRYYASLPTCVDCRTRGTDIKPPFWP